MLSTFALQTSDANLLRCQVDLIRHQVSAPGQPTPRAVGLGYFEADNILLRKRPGDVGRVDLPSLLSDVASEVLFFHVDRGGLAPFADEEMMPFRFRRWMWMQEGSIAAPRARERLDAELPDFLRRQLKGTTSAEICFYSFLTSLRREGRLEDYDIPAPLVGQALVQLGRRLQTLEREEGKAAAATLFATNGRVSAALRIGEGSLRYALLEGIARCERCGIQENTPDSNPLLRAHRKVRGVVLLPDGAQAGGLLEVPEGSAVTVGHRLDVQVVVDGR